MPGNDVTGFGIRFGSDPWPWHVASRAFAFDVEVGLINAPDRCPSRAKAKFFVLFSAVKNKRVPMPGRMPPKALVCLTRRNGIGVQAEIDDTASPVHLWAIQNCATPHLAQTWVRENIDLRFGLSGGGNFPTKQCMRATDMIRRIRSRSTEVCPGCCVDVRKERVTKPMKVGIAEVIISFLVILAQD